MTGESWDLAVRATHAPLERTNPVAPPSCPPAAVPGGAERRGEKRREEEREDRSISSVKSHGTLGMWQQFRQLEMPREILKVCLL